MGFWDSIRNSIRDSTKSTLSDGYKAYAHAVSDVGSKVVKATRATYDYVSEERVEETFKTVQEMIDLSERIRNDSRLLSFQNYTRYYVSVKFLQDLVNQREGIKSSADINLVFLNQIQKFLTDSISDSELLELDEQIQQL